VRKHALLLGGVAIALLLAVLSPFAATDPDGLEAVAERHGFAELSTSTVAAPLPDYLESRGPAGKAAAGVVGTLLVLGLSLGAARVLKRRER
jgi:hypothetical protein